MCKKIVTLLLIHLLDCIRLIILCLIHFNKIFLYYNRVYIITKFLIQILNLLKSLDLQNVGFYKLPYYRRVYFLHLSTRKNFCNYCKLSNNLGQHFAQSISCINITKFRAKWTHSKNLKYFIFLLLKCACHLTFLILGEAIWFISDVDY